MEDFKKKQLEAEQYCIKRLGKIPCSWNIQKNQYGFFCNYNNSTKNRYGSVKNCEYCNREFIAIREGLNACSSFCSHKKTSKKVKVNCSWCKNEVLKPASKLKASKSGLYFCGRKCKDEAQKIDGLKEIHPKHYHDGSRAYSERAFNEYGYKCVDCNVTSRTFLQVHHKDSDRNNGNIENLEVVCTNHHMLRHLRYRERTKEWVFDTKSLTPRHKLAELRILLNI